MCFLCCKRNSYNDSESDHEVIGYNNGHENNNIDSVKGKNSKRNENRTVIPQPPELPPPKNLNNMNNQQSLHSEFSSNIGHDIRGGHHNQSTSGLSYQDLNLNLNLVESVQKGLSNPGFKLEEESQIRVLSNSPPPFKMPEQSSEDVIEPNNNFANNNFSQEFREIRPISQSLNVIDNTNESTRPRIVQME